MEPVKDQGHSPAEPVIAVAAAPAEPAVEAAASLTVADAIPSPTTAEAVPSPIPAEGSSIAPAPPSEPAAQSPATAPIAEPAAQNHAAMTPPLPSGQPLRIVPITSGAEGEKLRPTRTLGKPPEPATPSRSSRFGLLAASIALAAGFGAAAGAAGTASVSRLLATPPPAPISVERVDNTGEIKALRESIAQMRGSVRTLSEGITTLRANADQSAKANQAQFAKLGETLDRLDRRATASAAAPEITGSINKPPPLPPLDPKAKPPVIEGWTLRDVYDGVAFVQQGRAQEGVEVVIGDDIRGVGRVQDIRRQDGRWVVVTNRGIIVSR